MGHGEAKVDMLGSRLVDVINKTFCGNNFLLVKVDSTFSFDERINKFVQGICPSVIIPIPTPRHVI
jgi:hypothetical protein